MRDLRMRVILLLLAFFAGCSRNPSGSWTMTSEDAGLNGTIELTGQKFFRVRVKSKDVDTAGAGLATAGRVAVCLGTGCRVRVLIEKFGNWRGMATDGLRTTDESWEKSGQDLIGPAGKKPLGGNAMPGPNQFIAELHDQVVLADDAEGLILLDLARDSGRGEIIRPSGKKSITLRR